MDSYDTSLVLGIIPARYGSSRFPGKPLALIAGKSLIQRTYENAQRCKALQRLLVATDDERIFDHVRGFGGEVLMTSPSCPTGTDRLVDVLQNSEESASIIVNIQGDHPCLDGDDITAVVKVLQDNPLEVMSTVVRPLGAEDAMNPSVVKCVLDGEGHALYFSRAPLAAAYHHLGLYAFRREFLLHYATLPITPLQRAEDLEQLKVLEHGYGIKVAITQQKESPSIDHPEDIKKVKQWLYKHGIYSSQAESSLP